MFYLFFVLDPGSVWRRTGPVPEWAGQHHRSHSWTGRTIDEITIKTPNPKCRLYWWLIEFIDWWYSQSCWFFRPLLWTIAPLTLPAPFLLCVLSVQVYIFIQCVTGGRGSGCVESINRSYTLCIRPVSETAKLLYHLKQKPRRGERPQTDKHPPPSPFTGQL